MSKVISDTPEWFNGTLSDAQRRAAIRIDFKRKVGQSEAYKNASPEKQEAYRNAHQRLVENAEVKSAFNPIHQQQAEDQQETDTGTFAGNLVRTMGRSVMDTASRAPMVDDLVGKPDANYAGQVAKYLTKRAAAPVTQEAKQLAHDMKMWGERTAASGTLGDIAATAGLIKDIVVNPKGILDVAAQSIGSMGAMIGGAKTGGAVAAGATAATGGWAAPAAPFITGAGMFAAGAADAASSKMVDRIQEELDKRELPYTPGNVQMLLDSRPDIIKEIQTSSMKYGGVLGAVDVALGGFFSKLSSLPTRAARKAAMQSMDDVTRAMLASKASELGVKVADLTEDWISRAAKDSLATKSLKSKLGFKALNYAGEVASEPISEAAGMVAGGEKINTEELIYETLGGIGAGPIGASLNTSVFGTKLAANKTGEFIKKAVTSTPETRAANKEINEKAQKVTQLANARNQAGYKTDVESIQADDTRIEEWADSSNENYNPIKAIEALSKFAEDPDKADKAEAIYAPIKEEAFALIEQMEAITNKDPKEITTQDKVLLESLNEQLEAQKALAKQATPFILAIREKNNKQAADKTVASIDMDTATSEQVIDHVSEAYGSSRTGLSLQQLDQRLQQTTLSETERTVLQSQKEAVEARQVVEKAYEQNARKNTDGKTLEQVQNDIYRGTSDFKGIDSFRAAISNFLNPSVNNTEGAARQVAGLKKFRDQHQTKFEALTQAFEEIKKVPYRRGEENRPSKRVRVGGSTYNIHADSGRLVAAIGNEVTALNKEVKAAESLLVAKTGVPATTIASNVPAPTAPSTQTTQTTPPATNAPKPVTAPATEAPASPATAAEQPSPETVTKVKQYAERMAKAVAEGRVTPEIVRQKEKAIQDKHGEQVARIFRDELKRLEKVNQENKNKQETEKTQQKQEEARTEEQKRETKTEEVDEDKKASTIGDNTDSVSAVISQEQVDPGEMPVTYTNSQGEQVTRPYNEAMVEIAQELREIQQILRCVKG